jgi:hypothetical protein
MQVGREPSRFTPVFVLYRERLLQKALHPAIKGKAQEPIALERRLVRSTLIRRYRNAPGYTSTG